MAGSSVSAGERIERFLAAHEPGPLLVLVGSASVKGIAWLAGVARDRPVTLFVGDLKASANFAHASDQDRRVASAFVSRGDVTVRNWYRTGRAAAGRAEAHLKVWAVCDGDGVPSAFLVGSANLTGTGLSDNVEVMAVADPSDHGYLRASVSALLSDAWDAKPRLVELTSGEATKSGQAQRRARGRERATAGAAANRGCMMQSWVAATLAVLAAVRLLSRTRGS